jgi:hypothetical protein
VGGGGGAHGAQRWFCGPEHDRRAYAVTDIDALLDTTVVRAERIGDGHRGPVSLKLNTDPSSIDAAEVASRLRAVAAIDHPNLGTPIESFVGPGLAREPERADTSNDVFYVAARWEDGVPLKSVVPLPPERALRVAGDIAGAVAALHRHGLAHRDLHPGNVIVRPDGSAVVIDFGTVRPDDGGETSTIAGVVGFIAPDTVTGGHRRDADRWGIGMLTVYALLGHPQGSTPTTALRRELEEALASTADPRGAASAILRMIDVDVARRPPDPAAWVARVERHLRRGRSARTVALVAAALLLTGAGVTAALLARDEEPTARDVPPRAASDIVAARAGPPSTGPAGSSARCTVGPAAAVPGIPDDWCWGGPDEPLAKGSSRRVLDDEGHPAGVVVTAPGGQVTYLTPTMWQSYSEITGRNQPINSPAYGGYPVGVDGYTDPDAVAIRLDTGGMIMGPRADSQLFWIPAQGVARWREAGGLRGVLGFPASNLKVTLDGAFVEFQHGRLSVAAADVALLQAGQDVPIRLEIPADPTEGLPVDAIRNAIIRQWGGHAWWVDAAGIRHWIPDAATWACLGGEDATFPGADQLAGWTVWLFDLGPPATCGPG